MAGGAVGRRVLGLLTDEARARGCVNDPVVRQGLARLHTLHRIMTGGGLRRTNADGNLMKLLNTQMLHLARSLAGQILGPDAAVTSQASATGGVLQELILFSPASSIYGGTDEIQRNVIGERGLGLPREPGPRDTPFRDLPKN